MAVLTNQHYTPCESDSSSTAGKEKKIVMITGVLGTTHQVWCFVSQTCMQGLRPFQTWGTGFF